MGKLTTHLLTGCFQKKCHPQIMNFNRVFHSFHHPFWGKTPIFGNTHVLFKSFPPPKVMSITSRVVNVEQLSQDREAVGRGEGSNSKALYILVDREWAGVIKWDPFGWKSKNRGFSPKMDGVEWKTLFFNGWFGGKNLLFSETSILGGGWNLMQMYGNYEGLSV